jgi:hypothetical protein
VNHNNNKISILPELSSLKKLSNGSIEANIKPTCRYLNPNFTQINENFTELSRKIMPE